MAQISWDQEAMSTGVPEVDAQHQEWIRRFNQFDEAINQGKGVDAIQKTLDFFITYADVHFTFEEAVMDKHNCPAAKDNREAHGKMRRILRGYKTYVEKHGFSILELRGLKYQMERWLIEHILTIDIQLRDT